MLAYIHGQKPASKDVLRRAAWYFCNEDEFAALGGRDPEEFRRQWWLDGLVIKAGEKGVTLHTSDGSVHVPALPKYPAFDTTGAGDAVAGGMLARWLTTGAQRGGHHRRGCPAHALRVARRKHVAGRENLEGLFAVFDGRRISPRTTTSARDDRGARRGHGRRGISNR